MVLSSRHLRCWCPFAIALFASASDVLPVARDPSPRPKPLRIAVLGDSLSVSPFPAASFPALLEARLRSEGLPWVVANAGVNGDTTAGGLRRIDRVLAERPRILVLALGANDGLQGVRASEVRSNLSEIISRAQAQGAQVLLCGMETPPFRGWSYTLDFHNIFPQLAREYQVPLVPFLLAGVVGVRELNQEDLIHPNANGARRIAETVWPYLERLVRDLTDADVRPA